MKAWLFLSTLALFSCTEDDITLVDAVMAGYDYRECVCCGGMVVNPSDGGGKIFQWYQKNENFGIDDSKNYPLNVRIKYHHISESCVSSDGEIEIDALHIQ